MTSQEKLIKRKQRLLELAEYLQNISQACKIHFVSRQHFYDIKKTYEKQGLEGMRGEKPKDPLSQESCRSRDRRDGGNDSLGISRLWGDPGIQ